MGKDFKAGLIAGAVLAGVALIWVATRPSLSPQARMPRTVPPPGGAGRPIDPPAGTNDSSSLFERPTASHALQESANDRSRQLNTMPSPAPESVRSGAAVEKPLVPAQVGAGQPRTGVPDLTVYEMNEPIKTTRFHIVRRGETLSAISQQYYGTKEKWQKILAANSRPLRIPTKSPPARS